jgi:hypothetical protein
MISPLLSASIADGFMENGGKVGSTQALHTMKQPSTLKIVTCAVPVPNVLRPGILDTYCQSGLNT